MESIRNVLRPRAKQLATNEIGALGSQQPQGGPSDPSNLAGHGAGTYGFERKRPATEAHTVDSEPKRHASLQENLFPKKQILGLRVLYNPGNPLVDIVFVHGLTGNSYRTWLHEDEGVYWPVHLLSKDIPDARILVFGYDADVTKFLDPVGQNNLRDHASCLVGDLAALRNQDKCTDRKIIFIVHSLGGLVTKKALCLSEQAFEPHLHQLDRHTIAIAFMGTPHRGSGLAPFASGIANILKACQMRVNREILKLLERDSEVLADVEASFAIWLRRNGSRFNLTCFFEELELRTVGMVVHKESAKIEGWPQFSIRANHMDMTKFAIAEDMGYQRICGELTRWLDPLRTPAATITLTQDEKACLQSLSFPEMNNRDNEIGSATKGTCEWLPRHPKYMGWISQRRGLLWIKGKPGAGKSTLMKSSFEALDPSERRSSTIYNVSFFFHGRGTELQKTPEGLLRSFLHQLLERFPKALSIVVETFRSKCLKMGNPGEKWNWHPRELQDFIESCLPKILETSAIRLFVDALDECGEEVARQLVRHFARLQSSCSSAQHGLSICFSCRHYPVVGPHKCLEIFVEHENHADIKKYITEELTDVMEDSKELAELRDQIEAQSEGVFQWVVLVIPDIAWGFQEGKTLRQLQAVSRDIPQKLDDLYQDILKRLREKDKYRSMKLFQWICFAQRPLSIAELRCAMNVDADPDCHSFQQCQMLPGFIDKDEQMEKQLKVLSGGLAEIKHHKYAKSTVQLIHQSVSDYLLASGFHNFEDTMTSRDIIAGKSHIRLFRSCVVYFTMDEIRDGDEDDDDWVDLDNTVAEKQYPFLSYAGMFWPTHAQLAEKVGLLQGDLLDTLRRPSSQTLQLWASTWDPADFNLKYIPSPKSTILHVAALFELWSVVFASLDKEKRRDTDVDSTDDDGRTLLSLAAERGHEAVVKLLLERNDVRSNSKDKSGRTPLSWAAEKGHDAVVKLLLAHNVKISLDGDDGWIDVMINLADNDGRTSLSWAAERGHEAVVKLLLAYSNVDVNLKDRRGLTPLSWAANRAHEAVVKLLLASSNVDVSCRDKDWWTLLLYATERENTVMVKLLLACGDVDVNSPCPFGRTLCSAIEGGHGAVVKLLLARDDVDVNLGGDRGCTPLLLATILGREAMVELLLAHSNVNVNSRDIYGRTPLLFAANSGDTVIVKLLLAHGDVDVNVLDRSGLTPLRLAAYGKHSTIVELLLAHSGINRNSRGENGWTPLSWAAWMGHEAEFRRLLSCSSFVDVNSKDNTGGTPLLWAAYRGREAVVKLLLARNDVEADSVDNVGNTPFSLAAGKGHEAVVKLLLERKDVKTDRTNKRNGKTPLMHAAEGGHEAIVKLLLTHGDVNVYQRDFCGRTPLSYAGKNEAVVDLLVSYGALYSYPLRADDLSDSDSEETSSASDE